MRTRITAISLALLGLLGLLGVMVVSGGASAAPDAAIFDRPVANPYFPLVPGTVSFYRGSEGREVLRERVAITRDTRRILGVETVVVRDVIRSGGLVRESTIDWYAADNDGNVWYFGERTATYDEQGSLESREGTWRAGVDGAVAGIIMPADPRPTDAYRQEFYPGHAEDQAWIVQRHLQVRVSYGLLRDVVRSFEWTRLEPEVVAAKYYAPGLGIVLERDVAGGNEWLELMRVKRP